LNPRLPRCEREKTTSFSPVLTFDPEDLPEFAEFMRINMRLETRTVRDTVGIIKRFLEGSKNKVTYDSVETYLKSYLEKRPKTYNSQITALRRFICDFLKKREMIESFKMAVVDYLKNVQVPTKQQMRSAFNALDDCHSKAAFLFVATTGLRKSEVLKLNKDKIDFQTRAVVPMHFNRTKRSGITFFSRETEVWLKEHLATCSENERLFVFSERCWKQIWATVSKAAGIKITPQILRVWFASEMGDALIPDRYIDIFEGRAPRSVLAKHYTAKGIERLKIIYEKADLNVNDKMEAPQGQAQVIEPSVS
jgi:integrase